MKISISISMTRVWMKIFIRSIRRKVGFERKLSESVDLGVKEVICVCDWC